MKYLIVLALALTGCHGPFVDSSWDRDDAKDSQFRYAEDAIVVAGFYEGDTCMVIREYESSVFCMITNLKNGDQLNEGFRPKLNLRKDNLKHPEATK